MTNDSKAKTAIGSAFIGAVVGAGAAAAAISLSDKKNREKLKKTISEARTKYDKITTAGKKQIEKAHDTADDIKQTASEIHNDEKK